MKRYIKTNTIVHYGNQAKGSLSPLGGHFVSLVAITYHLRLCITVCIGTGIVCLHLFAIHYGNVHLIENLDSITCSKLTNTMPGPVNIQPTRSSM